MVSRILRAPRSINGILAGLVAAALFLMFALPADAAAGVVVGNLQDQKFPQGPPIEFLATLDTDGNLAIAKMQVMVQGPSSSMTTWVPKTSATLGDVTSLSLGGAAQSVVLKSFASPGTYSAPNFSGDFAYTVVLNTQLMPPGVYSAFLQGLASNNAVLATGQATFQVLPTDDHEDSSFSCDDLATGVVDARCDQTPAPLPVSVLEVGAAGATVSVGDSSAAGTFSVKLAVGATVLAQVNSVVTTTSRSVTLLPVEVDVDIIGGNATSANPHQFSFVIDTPEGAEIATLKDGSVVPNCDPLGTATPDSCVNGIENLSNGKIDIQVLTTSGSTWNFGVVPPAPTPTPVPPTATPVPPTATPVPPTATPVPPTATPVPPTATPVPPTATPVPPTATPVPPTATPVPPAEPESGNGTLIAIVILVLVVLGGGGGFMFLRRRGS
jgi:hypothetical protein